MSLYQGQCHCGAVRFEIESDLQSVIMCDCSLCRKKNAPMVGVHKSDFRLIAGENQLATYQWNMKIAKHHFCKICGIYTFHRRRSQPDHYGVNLHCLEGVDLENVQITQVHGSRMSVAE